MPATRDREAIGTPGKISGIDLVTAQIFYVAKSEAREIVHERGGIEEQLKGFAGAGYSLRERVERLLLEGAEERSFHGEVECEAAAGRQAGNELDGGVKSGPRKIGRDAEPGEKRTGGSTESGLLQAGIE